MTPEPTIEEFIAAGTGAIRGIFDFAADTRRGSIHEQPLGAAAIIWKREARRDTDLFANTRFDTAEDAALTEYVSARWNIDRILDTYGLGSISISRASGGAGTIREGTRIILASSASDPVYYAVASDTAIGSTTLATTVPIRATQVGAGTAVVTQAAKFDDALWDSSWVIQNLVCADGTSFEPAPAFRARVRDELILRRKGYVDEITVACQNAGASHVVLFPSYYNGSTDFGLNVCYVGDDSFQTPPGMVNTIKLALETVRVCGDQLQVLPMRPSLVSIVATINLWDQPTRFNLDAIATIIRAAIVRYFDGGIDGGNSYDLDALSGDIRNATAAVQSVDFTVPASSATVMTGSNFPAILNRYTTTPSAIQLTFEGPL